MRNGFFLIALIALFFSACEEQPKDVTLTATPASFKETVSPTGSKDLNSVITNTSANSGTINWELSEEVQIAGWTYTVTIDGTAQTGLSGTFDIAANASKTFVVKVVPNNNTGTGKAKLTLKQNDVTRLEATYEIEAAMTGPKFSMSTNSDNGSATASNVKVEYKSKVTNLTSSNLDLRWVRTIDGNTPARWEVTICDNVQCHIPTVSTYDITIPANGNFDLKIGFNPKSILGTGDATVHLYEPSDSANTVQIFQAKHIAN